MNYLEINCAGCGGVFKIQPKRYNYNKKQGQKDFCCSNQCRSENRRKQKIEVISCQWCKNPFEINKDLTRKRKFCSQKCSGQYAQQFINAEKISKSLKEYYQSKEYKLKEKKVCESRRKYKVCPICKNKFYGYSKKYCSKNCLNIGWRKSISETRKDMFSNGELNVTGGNTKWLTYKNIRVQGSYEFRTCIILDKLKELNLIKDWKKSNFRISYTGEDNKSHTYLIDFEIFTNSGRILYLEIKGYIVPKDLLKWQETKRQGYKLLVWMISHLQQIEKKLKI